MRRLSPALSLSLLLATPPLSAQGNYRSSPIGGRSTLMGGTGLAYGRDGAAPYMNPATVLNVDNESLAFSVNFYTVTFFRGKSWYRPGPVDTARFGDVRADDATLTDIEFNALPSSLCLFLTATQTNKVAVCLANTQATSFSFSAESHEARASDGRLTRHAQTMLQSYSRFVFGPTYALQVSDRLSFGVSLHGSLVAHRSAMNAVANTLGATPLASSFYSGSRGDSAQVSAIVGLTYKSGRHTVGVSLETPSLHVFGVGAANRHTAFATAATTTSVSGNFTSATPLRVGVGAGLIGTRGLAELNFNLYAPMSSAYRATLQGTTTTIEGGAAREQPVDVTLSQRANTVFNASLGGEYFPYASLSVLGGLSTDFSATPELRADLLNYYPSRSHRLAASLGIGSHSDAGELIVGTEVSYAWGHRLVVNPYQLAPTLVQTPHSTWVVLFVVAGSTSLKTIRRAMSDAVDAIKPRP